MPHPACAPLPLSCRRFFNGSGSTGMRTLSATLLLSLSCSVVLAAEPLQLEPVKVVADAEPAWQSTTDEDGLSRPAADVGEALRDVNGVDGARMGGLGIDLVIRGQVLSRLNFLLDGYDVHTASS